MAVADPSGSTNLLDSLARLVQVGSTSPLALAALIFVILAFLALYFFRRDSLKIRLTVFFSLLVIGIVSGGAYFLTQYSVTGSAQMPRPDVPEPKRATIYRNASGTLFIEAEYDLAQLRRGETLSLEASTRENFDDVPRLLPQSEIESASAGKTQGRLSYDPGNQPVWYRFLVTDAQGKRWYGIPAIANRR
jgi:hypothetical protein